jgi:putative hydrolase of the HAD superfamily
MDIRINDKSFFIFDLDDTLYCEIDFLKSGYMEIANYLTPIIGINIYNQMWDLYKKGKDVFTYIVNNFQNANISFDKLLAIYRHHIPQINLKPGALLFLEQLKSYNISLGIITDGRSITQRNKLKALKIEKWFSEIIISEEFGTEKPNPKNYCYFTDKYPWCNFFFFGDNLGKDFIMPIKLSWQTFCLLDKGCNIHNQNEIHKWLQIHFIESFEGINLIYEQ